jgi:hypothetical protein
MMISLMENLSSFSTNEEAAPIIRLKIFAMISSYNSAHVRVPSKEQND